MSAEPPPERPEDVDREESPEASDQPRPAGRRIALNTAIFSIATGFSRVAGLIREVVASSYYGTTGPASAFTLAFQVPNLVRSLFADAALSAAFVPVFTELLETNRRKEAFNLAGALFGLILAVLGVITVIFMALAGVIIPLFTGPEYTAELDSLAVGLSRVLFPIVVLLGLNGLLVGILNAYDHFTIPAIAPLVWNLVIIAGMVGLRGFFEGPDELYAYAIGVLAGTVVQFAMALPPLRRVGFHLKISFNWRDPRIGQILKLMLPVTIGLGLINFNLLINTTLGFRVSEEAPAAIEKAFRIYMLPQGMFSVAVATVLFPRLSRLAARRDIDGLRPHAGQRRPPDRAAADPRRGGHARARHADHPPRLRARHVRRGVDPAGRRGAVLVLVQPAVRRARTCCSRARTSASRRRGRRPRWPASRC